MHKKREFFSKYFRNVNFLKLIIYYIYYILYTIYTIYTIYYIYYKLYIVIRQLNIRFFIKKYFLTLLIVYYWYFI